jgi:OOP family OmpA-OmpF porin
MKNFGITFFIFLVWSFFSLWLYSWLIPNNNIAINKNNVTNTSIVDDLNVATKEATENPLVKSTQINEITPIENTKTNTNSGLLLENEYGDAVFNFEESISYIKNSSELSIPESLKKFYKTIRTYLENNPNTEVHIISKYSAAENLETPNLGIKRGQQIADLLKNNNISKEKIVIKSIIDDLDFDVNDRYENAISFQ